MSKKRLSNVLSIIIVSAIIMFSFGDAVESADIALGADIGWLNQLENNGVTWQNDNGITQDPLEILQDHGVDSVRLRVFVNPPATFVWQKDASTQCLLGYGDKTGVVWMAQRVQNLGMKVMIDFHYSDHFADPAYQDKPEAWENYTFNQLVAAVYNHTYEIMDALRDEGVYPEWVQVGNEINSGMLWPEGSTNNFSQLTQLLNSGYNAVKAVSPNSKVITHLAHGADNGTFRWFFDNFITAYGGQTDVIGASYYPYWDGVDYTVNIDDLEDNLNDMVSRYGKDVIVVETGGLENNPSNTKNMLEAVIDVVKDIANRRGLGVFYWEPEANSSVLPDGYSLGATTAVSANVLRFTTAIDGFSGSGGSSFPDTGATYRIVNRNSGKDLNVAGGSTSDGANIEQYSYGGWDSQHWQLIDAGNGYYKIRNVHSYKLMDIEGASTSDGAENIQWHDTGGYNQQWEFTDAGDGYYKIENRNSGKILDINGASTQDGALSIQYYDNGGWNQMWSFIAVN